MYWRSDYVPTVAEIASKLEDEEPLTVPDVKGVLHIESTVENGPLADWEDELDDAISPELGHAAFVTLLGDLRDARIVDGLRRDLIDPSVDPDGFEKVPDGDPPRYLPRRIEKDATEGVGSVFAPVKWPSSVYRIHRSLLDYLCCVGKGFNLDSEMIYHRENDYGGLLELILEPSALDEYGLTVEADGPDEEHHYDVTVTVTTDGRVYERRWEDYSDYVNSEALDPVRDALDREVGQEIHYAPGNFGWLLVLDADVGELGLRYLLNPAPYRQIQV